MNPKSVGILQASNPDGQIALTVTNSTLSLSFLGGSIPSNVLPDTSGCHSLLFHPKKRGVVAIEVVRHEAPKSRAREKVWHFVIPIEQQGGDGEYRFDLEHVYFPPAGMAYRFDASSGWDMYVDVGGERFSTNSFNEETYEVPNANILCSLLAEDITVDEAKQAVIRYPDETNLRRAFDRLLPLFMSIPGVDAAKPPEQQVQLLIDSYKCLEARVASDAEVIKLWFPFIEVLLATGLVTSEVQGRAPGPMVADAKRLLDFLLKVADLCEAVKNGCSNRSLKRPVRKAFAGTIDLEMTEVMQRLFKRKERIQLLTQGMGW